MKSPIQIAAVLMLVIYPLACTAQVARPLGLRGKLRFHAEQAYGPPVLAGIAAIAGFQEIVKAPGEWGPGGAGYGRRIGAVGAVSGTRGLLAFGLDSTLHQDPRYHRSQSPEFWRRMGHAVRGTILTRTDAGGETLSTWRLGSDYGAAFITNAWYPGRLNNLSRGFIQGSAMMGLDLATNIGVEFWPDVKRRVLRRK
jgi:hypothetical protein